MGLAVHQQLKPALQVQSHRYRKSLILTMKNNLNKSCYSWQSYPELSDQLLAYIEENEACRIALGFSKIGKTKVLITSVSFQTTGIITDVFEI